MWNPAFHVDSDEGFGNRVKAAASLLAWRKPQAHDDPLLLAAARVFNGEFRRSRDCRLVAGKLAGSIHAKPRRIGRLK